MDPLPCLETEAFYAFLADNRPAGIHHHGYNGLASLVPKHTGNNLFHPAYAGLNYENITLAGLTERYQHPSGWHWEPRCEPMHVESADERRVVLVQPETSYSHVAARITFTAEEPCRLHQRIELTFHKRFCGAGEANWFCGLFASYLHMPPDLRIYMKDESADDLAGWVGLTKPDHRSEVEDLRPLPADRELSPAEHIAATEAAAPVPAAQLPWLPAIGRHPEAVPQNRTQPLRFYYGLVWDELFLMMFRNAGPLRFHLAYSPCGAGKVPLPNPAWDYLLMIDDAELNHPYVWELCLVAKPFAGRRDVMNEVRRYLD